MGVNYGKKAKNSLPDKKIDCDAAPVTCIACVTAGSQIPQHGGQATRDKALREIGDWKAAAARFRAAYRELLSA